MPNKTNNTARTTTWHDTTRHDTSSTAASTNCTACPAGYFCDSSEAGPQPCEVGYHSTGGSATCTACEPGYHCPEASVEPMPPGSECPKGTYCNPSSSLLECPAGTFGESFSMMLSHRIAVVCLTLRFQKLTVCKEARGSFVLVGNFGRVRERADGQGRGRRGLSTICEAGEKQPARAKDMAD